MDVSVFKSRGHAARERGGICAVHEWYACRYKGTSIERQRQREGGRGREKEKEKGLMGGREIRRRTINRVMFETRPSAANASTNSDRTASSSVSIVGTCDTGT